MARRAPDPIAPASPPKRVTRARTRTTVAKEEANKGTTKTATATTTASTAPKRGRPKKVAPEPASKPAARARAPAAATNTQTNAPKRRAPQPKTVQTPNESDSSDDEVDVVTVRSTTRSRSTRTSKPPVVPAPRTKRGSRAIVKNVPEDVESEDDDDDELAQAEQPKPKAVLSKKPTATSRKDKTVVSETRSTTSRARKDTAATRARASKPTVVSKASVRTAGQSEIVPASTSWAKNKAASNVSKKKVTFLDVTEDSDKENQPLPPPVTAKRKTKAETGLKAKPVRRPATPVSREEDEGLNSKAQPKKEPLSPKKPNQLVKPSPPSTSDNDSDPKDQTEPKTVLKTPQKLPVKRLSLGPSLASPAKKIDFTASRRLTESSLRHSRLVDDSENITLSGHGLMPFKDSTIMSTPARRVPQSPFKGSIKESPRKVPITFEPVTRSRPEFSPIVKASPLKESARRVKGVPFLLQRAGELCESSAMDRRSLLKSPAKRLRSPSKLFPSPSKDQRHAVTAENCEQDTSLESYPNDDVMETVQTDSEPDSPMPERMDHDFMGDDAFNDEFTSCDPERGGPQTPSLTNESPQPSPGHEVEVPCDMEDPFLSSGEQSCVATPVRAYEIGSGNSSVSSIRHFGGVPPPVPSPPVFAREYPPQFTYRDDPAEADSDAESMMSISPSKSPARRQSIRLVREDSDSENQTPVHTNLKENIGFTPLADKLSQWKPVEDERKYPRRRSMFSLAPGDDIGAGGRRSLGVRASRVRESHGRRTSFMVSGTAGSDCDDDTMIHEPNTSEDILFEDEDNTNFTILEDSEETFTTPLSSRNKMDSMEDITEALAECGGDENAFFEEPTITINTAMFEEQLPEEDMQQNPHNMLPMSVTPVRSGLRYPRTIHTVSKVPLKTGDGSLNVPRKRTRSFSSGTNSPLPSMPLAPRSNTMPSPRRARSPLKAFIPAEQDDDLEAPSMETFPERPKQPPPSSDRRRSRSPRKQSVGYDQVLQGTVIYTDIHTKEGADASGIFVELLTQMGARCVKSWNWNPRTSLSPVDGVEPKESKIGITHVIFKDGAGRTLEKVGEANGVVKCVGVNWVLDCERSNKWLDEAEYAVDISMVPRGGQKRRKSMEPRALGNVNGSVVNMDSSVFSGRSRRSSINPEIMQDFLRHSPTPTPPSSRDTSVESDYNEPEDLFSTPKPKRQAHPPIDLSGAPDYSYSYDYDPATSTSPTTPYYLTEGAQLVQRTCPPKELRQGLFPGKNTDNEGCESLKLRLDAARRKSLLWKPKIGSPLGRRYS